MTLQQSVAKSGARRLPRPGASLVVAALAVLATLALAGDALACSCVNTPVRERLDEADAAFVGRMVGRQEIGGRTGVEQVLYTFVVDQSVKGALPKRVQVRSAAASASCGLTPVRDEAVGLLLTRAGTGWAASLCTQVAPGDLLGSEDDLRGDAIRIGIGVVIALLVLGYSLRRLRQRRIASRT